MVSADARGSGKSRVKGPKRKTDVRRAQILIRIYRPGHPPSTNTWGRGHPYIADSQHLGNKGIGSLLLESTAVPGRSDQKQVCTGAGTTRSLTSSRVAFSRS